MEVEKKGTRCCGWHGHHPTPEVTPSRRPLRSRRRSEARQARRSYLPEEIRCAGSSAPAPAASSWVPRREGPPFSRAPGTNPESAKIASRPLPSPLLRSLSFLLLLLLLLFFNLVSLPSPHTASPPTRPPHPRLQSARPEAGEGGGRWGRRLGRGRGKVATRKFKQTNTPTPSPPLPASLGQKLCGWMRRAGPRGEAGGAARPAGRGRSRGPPTGTGERRALARRAKVSEPRGCGVDSSPYLFIYLFSRSLSTPTPRTPSSRLSQTILATPCHTSRHTPAPGTLGEGRRCLSGFGA